MYFALRVFNIFNPFAAITTMSTKEILLQAFILILKHSLRNYKKILKKCFFGTTWRVILSESSNIQPHTGVLPVVRGYLTRLRSD